MTDVPGAREPSGRDEAETQDAGEPQRETDRPQSAAEDERPDLDERERRLSTRRKAPGPPLEKEDATREEDETRAEGPEERPDERPVDPS
jgi:hypothetical protein